HPLARAFEAVTAEPAEKFLRAVGGEDDANRDAQGKRGPAGVGGQQARDQGMGHGVSPWVRCRSVGSASWGAALTMDGTLRGTQFEINKHPNKKLFHWKRQW